MIRAALWAAPGAVLAAAMLLALFGYGRGLWCDGATEPVACHRDMLALSGIWLGLVGAVILAFPGLREFASTARRFRDVDGILPETTSGDDPLDQLHDIRQRLGHLHALLAIGWWPDDRAFRRVRAGLWLVVLSFVIQGLAITVPWLAG